MWKHHSAQTYLFIFIYFKTRRESLLNQNTQVCLFACCVYGVRMGAADGPVLASHRALWRYHQKPYTQPTTNLKFNIIISHSDLPWSNFTFSETFSSARWHNRLMKYNNVSSIHQSKVTADILSPTTTIAMFWQLYFDFRGSTLYFTAYINN